MECATAVGITNKFGDGVSVYFQSSVNTAFAVCSSGSNKQQPGR